MKLIPRDKLVRIDCMVLEDTGRTIRIQTYNDEYCYELFTTTISYSDFRKYNLNHLWKRFMIVFDDDTLLFRICILTNFKIIESDLSANSHVILEFVSDRDNTMQGIVEW